MPLPLLALGGLAAAGSAGASLYGRKKARKAARKGRSIERSRLERQRERLADVYRRRDIGLKERNVGLEGSGVAASRERELAQNRNWDMANVDDALKMNRLSGDVQDYENRMGGIQDIAGVVGGGAAGLSMLQETPMQRAMRLASRAGSSAFNAFQLPFGY